MAWLQHESTAQPQKNVSDPQFEEHSDDKDGEDIVDYKPDVDYKPEGDYEPDAQEEKKKRSPHRICKMMLPHQGTLSGQFTIEDKI